MPTQFKNADSRSDGFAAKLAALPRLALEASKRLINRGVEVDLTTALELESRSLAALATSHDARKGAQALLQKKETELHR